MSRPSQDSFEKWKFANKTYSQGSVSNDEPMRKWPCCDLGKGTLVGLASTASWGVELMFLQAKETA